MTCLRQHRFRNPIKEERRTSFDKYTIHGSCGNCAGCAKRKQNDWLVRSYFEYNSRRYCSYFVTLDFDEENLPRYNGIPCFDSKLMSRFFDSLRNRLNCKFRYLYSSHLGDAMKRPHYHVMFFFFNDIDEGVFWSAINDIWHYGHHEDISKLRSVRGNPLSAVEYVCKYTVFSFSVKNQFKKFPKQYRPQTHASVGFGAQCMDPHEFESSRLLKEDILFNDTPVITRDYILNNSLVYIDVKRDGILVPFSIPRYYEMKLMFDWSWNSELKRQEALKNDYGKELQKIRHNAHYISLYEGFVNSRSIQIHNDNYTNIIVQNVIPDSPYLGVCWSDVVDDVLQDQDAFYDFCKYYSWLEFDNSKFGYLRYRPLRFHNVNGSLGSHVTSSYDNKYTLKGFSFHCASLDSYSDIFDCDDIDLYLYAMTHFRIWQDVERHRKAEFEDWKIQEAVKQKILAKCKNNLSFRWHLRRHHFKFYSLKPKSYVSHYQIKEN